jgi:hypothetical protein
MLAFYGFELEQRGPNSMVIWPPSELKSWITPGNHNFLRITRILKCLILLDLKRYAMLFFRSLELVFSEWKKIIGEDTFNHWSNAIRYGLTLDDLRRRLHKEKEGVLKPMRYEYNGVDYTVFDLISEVERDTLLGSFVVAISGTLRSSMQNDPDQHTQSQSIDIFEGLLE